MPGGSRLVYDEGMVSKGIDNGPKRNGSPLMNLNEECLLQFLKNDYGRPPAQATAAGACVAAATDVLCQSGSAVDAQGVNGLAGNDNPDHKDNKRHGSRPHRR